MISNLLSQTIGEQLSVQIQDIQPVSGGDINEAYRLTSADGQVLFLKINQGESGSRMLTAERNGLDMLARFWPVTPRVLGAGQVEQQAFLALEWIESVPAESLGWERFGRQLAKLHKTFSDEFGLDHDNFIGNLPQSNFYAYDWSSFYLSNRLEPQLKMAIDAGHLDLNDLKHLEKLGKKLPDICPDEPPALIHGDLWSGNFLISADQQPVLIDPAVSFAHREMDLAMTRLFGGFDPVFYQSYEETYPLAPNFQERIAIYQLYYLLAHVNIFGFSYVAAVRRILQQYA